MEINQWEVCAFVSRIRKIVTTIVINNLGVSCCVQVELLILKVVSKSHMIWVISVPIVVFLGFCSRFRVDKWRTR